MATRMGAGVRTRRWTRAEYDRLILAGLLDEDEPIERLDGQLVVREPESAGHSAAIWLAQAVLRRAFGRGWLVRGPAPVALDPASEPAPDLTVVRGSPRTYARDHPARPAPGRSPSAAVGGKYGSLERLGAAAVVSPLARPRARIRVADLLP